MALGSDLLISLYVVFMFMTTCLAVRVAVDISWMPEPSKPDRALSSLLTSILVLQRKFSAEVDVKMRKQLAENGDTSGLVSCEDMFVMITTLRRVTPPLTESHQKMKAALDMPNSALPSKRPRSRHDREVIAPC